MPRAISFLVLQRAGQVYALTKEESHNYVLQLTVSCHGPCLRTARASSPQLKTTLNETAPR